MLWRTLLNELVRSFAWRCRFMTGALIRNAPYSGVPHLTAGTPIRRRVCQDGKPTSLAIGPTDDGVAVGTDAGFVILLESTGKRAMRECSVRVLRSPRLWFSAVSNNGGPALYPFRRACRRQRVRDFDHVQRGWHDACCWHKGRLCSGTQSSHCSSWHSLGSAVYLSRVSMTTSPP